MFGHVFGYQSRDRIISTVSNDIIQVSVQKKHPYTTLKLRTPDSTNAIERNKV